MARVRDPRNERAFGLATRQLLSAFTSAADREANDFSRRLTEIARKHQANLFRAMGGELSSFPDMFGLENPPSILQRSSFYRDWAELSPRYRASKGGKNEFWKNVSPGLREHIMAQDPIKILGEPRVRTTGTGQLNEGYEFDRGGRPRPVVRRRDGSRGLGPFAAYRDAFRPGSVAYSATVQIFTNLRGRSMASVFEALAGPDEKMRQKLLVTEFGRSRMRGKSVKHPGRPLFRPFIQFYGEVLIPELIKRDIRDR